jgi:hypothetical protein
MKMNAINKNIYSNYLEHSEHYSWHECHCSEHSWCKNESNSECSLMNCCKTIFVSGVSA